MDEGQVQLENERTHDQGGMLEKESVVRERGLGMDRAPKSTESTTFWHGQETAHIPDVVEVYVPAPRRRAHRGYE